MDETQTSSLVEYLHGRLDRERALQLERQIDEDLEARKQVEFLELLASTMRRCAPVPADDAGLSRTLEAIGQGSNLPAHTPAVRRLRTWLQGMVPSWPATGNAQFAMAVVIAVQFGGLALLASERWSGYDETRALAGSDAMSGPFIKVSLKPDSRESEFRFLLVSIGASIVGGPTQLGDYFLYLDKRRADWALQRLQQSPIVDRATLIVTLPAPKE